MHRVYECAPEFAIAPGLYRYAVLGYYGRCVCYVDTQEQAEKIRDLLDSKPMTDAACSVVEAAQAVVDQGKRTVYELSESITVKCDDGGSPLARLARSIYALRAERKPKPRYRLDEFMGVYDSERRRVMTMQEISDALNKAEAGK